MRTHEQNDWNFLSPRFLVRAFTTSHRFYYLLKDEPGSNKRVEVGTEHTVMLPNAAAHSAGTIRCPDALRKIITDYAGGLPYWHRDPLRTRSLKAGMCNGEDKPAAGLENAVHGLENCWNIIQIHQSHDTDTSVEVAIWQFVCVVSITMRVVNAQRGLLFMLACNRQQILRQIDACHTRPPLRKLASNPPLPTGQVADILLTYIADKRQYIRQHDLSVERILAQVCIIPPGNVVV